MITYDHRGAGQCTRGDGPISMASLAADLAALLGELEIDRADVLDWSLGSTVAQELALRHPQRVDRLVLAGTWGRTAPGPRFDLLTGPRREPRRAARTPRRVRRLVIQFLP